MFKRKRSGAATLGRSWDLVKEPIRSMSPASGSCPASLISSVIGLYRRGYRPAWSVHGRSRHHCRSPAASRRGSAAPPARSPRLLDHAHCSPRSGYRRSIGMDCAGKAKTWPRAPRLRQRWIRAARSKVGLGTCSRSATAGELRPEPLLAPGIVAIGRSIARPMLNCIGIAALEPACPGVAAAWTDSG